MGVEKLPPKIMSQCREQARRVYHGAVFEVKQEIPENTQNWQARGCYHTFGLKAHIAIPGFCRLKNAMTNQSPKHRQPITGTLRYRGLFFSSLLALREILRPFMYWHAWHIFQTDLQRPLPEPYAKEQVDVRIYIGRENLEEIAAQISSMGNIPLADVKFRFGRSDAAAVAYVRREAAGFMWMAFAEGAELAFGVNWILHENETLRYDSFVVPRWRGLGIHSAMNRALTEYARDRGLTRALSAISVVNPQSLNLAKHNRNPKVMTLILIHFRGVNWTYAKTIGAPFDSRFSRSSKDLYRARKSVGDEL